MTQFMAAFLVGVVALPLLAAEGLPPQPGHFSASLQEGGHEVAFDLGQHGAWLVQTRDRWDALLARLRARAVKFDDQLGPVDFDKESLACVFHYGDEGDRFCLRAVTPDPKRDGKALDVQFGMSYIIYKQRRALTVSVWQAYAVRVPKTASTTISVWTYHPMNGGPYPTLDRAKLEWQCTASDATGEAIGYLTGAIAPKAPRVKAGDDIPVQFTLSFADAAREALGQFHMNRPQAVSVWDGKYSNGYRNHGFEVVTPDGKRVTLRPKVIDRWDKNAPHPVAVAPGKPYTLPNWVEGDTLKSLKALGLDTTTPGKYTITGTYEEQGLPAGDRHGEIWGGLLRTNTVVVEVERP